MGSRFDEMDTGEFYELKSEFSALSQRHKDFAEYLRDRDASLEQRLERLHQNQQDLQKELARYRGVGASLAVVGGGVAFFIVQWEHIRALFGNP